MFFSIVEVVVLPVVDVVGFVTASLLLLVCLICWFVGLFVTCAFFKFELSIRVALGTDFLLFVALFLQIVW